MVQSNHVLHTSIGVIELAFASFRRSGSIEQIGRTKSTVPHVPFDTRGLGHAVVVTNTSPFRPLIRDGKIDIGEGVLVEDARLFGATGRTAVCYSRWI